MAQSKRAAARQQTVSQGSVVDSLLDLLDQTPEGQMAGLRDLANLQQQRVKRLAQVQKRLSKSLGKDHPRVVVLNQKAEQARELQAAAERPMKRTKQVPKVGPDSWLILGHVTFADDQPAVDLQVFLADANNKPVKSVTPVKTDKMGDFSLMVNPSALKERTEKKSPEFFLNVIDTKGNVPFSSQTPLRPEAGKIDYFDIMLAEK